MSLLNFLLKNILEAKICDQNNSEMKHRKQHLSLQRVS